MMEAFVRLGKFLNSAELTAKFQRLSGVYYVTDSRTNGHAPGSNNSTARQYSASERPPVAHKYQVLNYIFTAWTAVGDEFFFILFLPFAFWNFDYWVARRMVLLWSFAMYIGQAAKDVFCWPRPACPPAVRIADRHEIEYSMPSTHAVSSGMVAFTILVFTAGRYDYPLWIGICAASTLTLMVSLSRMYKGLHTVLDLMAGLALVTVVTVAGWFCVDTIDAFLLSPSIISPITTLAVSVGALAIYPYKRALGLTKADTSSLVAVFCGIYIGLWWSVENPKDVMEGMPFPVQLPTYDRMILGAKHYFFGLVLLGMSKVVFKKMAMSLMCFLVGDKHGPPQEQLFVQVSHRFINYTCLCIACTYAGPKWFRLLGIPLVPDT